MWAAAAAAGGRCVRARAGRQQWRAATARRGREQLQRWASGGEERDYRQAGVRIQGRRRDITLTGAKEVEAYVKALQTVAKESA